MGLFDRFKKQNDSVLPSDVDEYYKSEFKDRRSSSVLMALLALAITLVVAAGLFFGSRTIYRTFNDNDSGKATEQTADKTEKKEAENKATDSPNNTGQSSPNNQNSANDNETNNSQTPPSQNNSPSAGDIPSTGDNQLPSTGDEGM